LFQPQQYTTPLVLKPHDASVLVLTELNATPPETGLGATTRST